jgi:glycosyltransferase involved in cell wall biosynthesis/protein-tyrosine-phosphatase
MAIGKAGTLAPLRVCHIMTADLWAGAEVQVASIARYLGMRPEVKLTAVLFNEGWLARELRRLGLEVAVVDEKRHSAVQILTFLVKFLREHNIELVHTHRYKDTILGAVAAKLSGVAHVIRTVHGRSELLRGWDRTKLLAYDALDRLVLRCCADRVVAVSTRMAESLARSWMWPSAVTTIHNGVDLLAVRATRSSAEVRRAFGIAPDDLVIGTAGRLSPVKGHVYLVRAARLILDIKPRARFLFLGAGPLHDELSAATAALGLSAACSFIDPVTDVRAGIYDLMAAMDVFVLPSLDEGVPMALLEAMALGRPAVAAAVGGVPEIITHRVTGLLVKPRDDRAIADACLALAFDRHWARLLAASGREVVETKFSQQKSGSALINLYRELARDNGHAVAAGTRTWIGRYIRSRVICKLESVPPRLRMMRIRRDPAALKMLLQSAATMLILCHGNIIRSPFAARLMMRSLPHPRIPIAILSAGMEADPGRRPDPGAVRTASLLGIDLRDHAATPITPEMVAAADVIFVMDIRQLVVIRRCFPQAYARTFLMTSLCPDGPLEIHDPFGGDAATFHHCYTHIVRAVAAIVRVIAGDAVAWAKAEGLRDD